MLHHGRGTDERDLLGLADALDPRRRLHVVTPRAPLQLPGSPGYHWYLVPRVGYPDHDTFHAAREALAELHDGLWAETGIEPARTVFGGFSMGAVMSYAMALSRGSAGGRRDPRLQRLRPDRRGLAAEPRGSPRTPRPSSPTAATTRSSRSASPAAPASCSRRAGLEVDVPRVRRRPPDRPGRPRRRDRVAVAGVGGLAAEDRVGLEPDDLAVDRAPDRQVPGVVAMAVARRRGHVQSGR